MQQFPPREDQPQQPQWPQYPPSQQQWRQPPQQQWSQYPSQQNIPSQSQQYYPQQQMPPQQPGWQPQQPMYQQPPMQPTQPPKKPFYRSPLGIGCGALLVFVLACGIIAIASNAAKSTNTGTAVNSSSASVSNPTTAQSQPTDQHFKVGQTVKVGDVWQVQLQATKTSTGSTFFKPQTPGDVFLIVTISVKNISASEQAISSALQFHLQDASGQEYTETIYPDAGTTLDGKVEAGALRKGSIVYEVPQSAHQYTLGFEANIVQVGQTIWDIKV